MKYFSLCFAKFCCLLLDAISFVLNHYCLLWINYWCDSAMLQFYVCCQVMQSLLVPCLLWLVCVHLPIDTHCDHLLTHPPPPLDPLIYPCVNCLQFHRPKRTAEFKCEYCDYWVVHKRLLKQHMRLHTAASSSCGTAVEISPVKSLCSGT